MCGITGGIGLSAPQQLLLDAQLKSIEHRGPDDTGTYVNNGIGIGMCRLAIVEIAAGKQPASDASEQIHIVWNGEIYNYRENRLGDVKESQNSPSLLKSLFPAITPKPFEDALSETVVWLKDFGQSVANGPKTVD